MLRRTERSGVLLLALAWASCSFDTSNVANLVDDNAMIDGGGVVDSDVPSFDASADAEEIAPDANLCAPPCSSCDDGVCVVDCASPASCDDEVICPAGLACQVSCGKDACSNGVDCSAADSCDINCDGDESCAGQVECGTGPCDVSCGGDNSCSNGTTCDQSCACNVDCSGAASCANATECPAGCSASDAGDCTVLSPGPEQCDLCL